MEQFDLNWSHGRATIFEDGASLHYLGFDLGGRNFKPFAEAPWQGDYLKNPHHSHPRHLQLLGGEWPCIPFGTSHHDPSHHGFGTDHPWQVIEHHKNTITLGIDYPEDHMIKSLHRTITGLDGDTAIEFSLTIEPRKSGTLPIGLHPIFKLTDDLKISVSGTTHGHTFPKVFEKGISILSPRTSFGADGICPSKEGPIDILSSPSILKEELVQLFRLEGDIALNYPEDRVVINLKWDADFMPYCLMWISNRGRGNDPWKHRFRGIGIEPVNSYFDINDEAPKSQNYGYHFKAGQKKTITYRLSARTSG